MYIKRLIAIIARLILVCLAVAAPFWKPQGVQAANTPLAGPVMLTDPDYTFTADPDNVVLDDMADMYGGLVSTMPGDWPFGWTNQTDTRFWTVMEGLYADTASRFATRPSFRMETGAMTGVEIRNTDGTINQHRTEEMKWRGPSDDWLRASIRSAARAGIDLQFVPLPVYPAITNTARAPFGLWIYDTNFNDSSAAGGAIPPFASATDSVSRPFGNNLVTFSRRSTHLAYHNDGWTAALRARIRLIRQLCLEEYGEPGHDLNWSFINEPTASSRPHNGYAARPGGPPDGFELWWRSLGSMAGGARMDGTEALAILNHLAFEHVRQMYTEEFGVPASQLVFETLDLSAINAGSKPLVRGEFPGLDPLITAGVLRVGQEIGYEIIIPSWLRMIGPEWSLTKLSWHWYPANGAWPTMHAGAVTGNQLLGRAFGSPAYAQQGLLYGRTFRDHVLGIARTQVNGQPYFPFMANAYTVQGEHSASFGGDAGFSRAEGTVALYTRLPTQPGYVFWWMDAIGTMGAQGVRGWERLYALGRRADWGFISQAPASAGFARLTPVGQAALFLRRHWGNSLGTTTCDSPSGYESSLRPVTAYTSKDLDSAARVLILNRTGAEGTGPAADRTVRVVFAPAFSAQAGAATVWRLTAPPLRNPGGTNVINAARATNRWDTYARQTTFMEAGDPEGYAPWEMVQDDALITSSSPTQFDVTVPAFSAIILVVPRSDFAPIPTLTPIPTNTHTPTLTATNTRVPTPTSTFTRTPTATNTRVPTLTPAPTRTFTPSLTPTAITLTPTPSNTPTATNTATITPTATATNTPTNTPTNTATNTPTNTPTVTRTPTHTRTPTNTPTASRTPEPTNTPVATPTPGPQNSVITAVGAQEACIDAAYYTWLSENLYTSAVPPGWSTWENPGRNDCVIQPNGQSAYLVKWPDLGQQVTGRVTRATLRVNLRSPYIAGQPETIYGSEVSVYALGTYWRLGQVNWRNRFNSPYIDVTENAVTYGRPWGGINAGPASSDFTGTRILNRYYPSLDWDGEIIQFDLPVSLVQTWADNPGLSFGLAFVAEYTGVTGEKALEIGSLQETDRGTLERPLLTVWFTTNPPTPTPGIKPSSTPTRTRVPTNTPWATATPVTPTATNTPTPSNTPTAITLTPTPSNTPTTTPTPSNTPTRTRTATPTPTRTATPVPTTAPGGWRYITLDYALPKMGVVEANAKLQLPYRIDIYRNGVSVGGYVGTLDTSAKAPGLRYWSPAAATIPDLIVIRTKVQGHLAWRRSRYVIGQAPPPIVMSATSGETDGPIAGNWALGDCNGDNKIDVLDFSILSAAWGSYRGGPGWDARADLNNDGFVNDTDYARLVESYGLTGEN